jgi:hypothetical protein
MPRRPARTFYSDEEQEQRAKIAMKSCRADLQRSLGVRISARELGCGNQGCVYKIGAPRGLRPEVLKITIPSKDNSDAPAAMWLDLLRGGDLDPRSVDLSGAERRFHPALPRLKRVGVGKLSDCLRGSGIKSAFVTVRESLADVNSRMPGLRAAAMYLNALEDHAIGGGYDPQSFIDRLPVDDVTAQAGFAWSDPAARLLRTFVSLHVWLWERGLVVGDLMTRSRSPQGGRYMNIGVRWNGAFVVRDLGQLRSRRGAADALHRRGQLLARRLSKKGYADKYAAVLAGLTL